VKAVLLAAGEGKRLRPLTNTIPKCMVSIGGKPILERNIEWLRKHGMTDLVINLYHLPYVIQNYFGDGSRWGVHITYSLETAILGTAGGVKRVAELFDDTILVWYGDNLSTCDLTRMVDFHRAKGGLVTIALYQREDVTQSGIVSLDDQERITRLLEKPKADQVFSHWVNAGIYILERFVLEFIPSEGAPDFGRDVFPALLMAGQSLYGYRMSASEGLWWIDTMEDFCRTQDDLMGRSIL
jgi:NDP-sugar pyrophosphorylase family protein